MSNSTRSGAPLPIRWGILGPGKISRAFAAGLREAAGAELAAVGSRDLQRARAFADEFGCAQAHGSYEDLAADPTVDAIYIGTPHSEHEANTLLCLNAGKHVLCEKAFALNAVQAENMIRTARTRGLALMEAMWTRFLPAVVSVREKIAGGAVGEVRMLQADFGFRSEFDPESRLFNPALAGGTLLDIGIYPLSLAFMLFGEPVEVFASANLGATGVDEEAAMLLRHAQGQLSVLNSSFLTNTPREAHIIGTEGRITISFPWWAASRFVLHPNDGPDEVFEFDNRGLGYTYEAEAFMEVIRSGKLESEIMPLDETLAIMRTMDSLRAGWGMRYPGE